MVQTCLEAFRDVRRGLDEFRGLHRGIGGV